MPPPRLRFAGPSTSKPRCSCRNLRRPSLRAKKYDETRDVWQARVSREWRFYFRIEGEVYQLIEMIRHPKGPLQPTVFKVNEGRTRWA